MELEQLRTPRSETSSGVPGSAAERYEVKQPESGKTKPVVKQTAAKTSPKPKASPSAPPPVPETDAAKQARLRRMCERKPSGRIQVPLEVHQRWLNGGRAERDAMVEELEACGWDKASCLFFQNPALKYWINPTHVSQVSTQRICWNYGISKVLPLVYELLCKHHCWHSSHP